MFGFLKIMCLCSLLINPAHILCRIETTNHSPVVISQPYIYMYKNSEITPESILKSLKEDAKQWMEYVYHCIHVAIIKGTINTADQTFRAVFRFINLTIDHYYRQPSGENESMLTSPFGLLLEQPTGVGQLSWTFLTYTKFMINITIIEAYVPYTDSCEYSSITVYEGHEADILQETCICSRYVVMFKDDML